MVKFIKILAIVLMVIVAIVAAGHLINWHEFFKHLHGG